MTPLSSAVDKRRKGRRVKVGEKTETGQERVSKRMLLNTFLHPGLFMFQARRRAEQPQFNLPPLHLNQRKK